MPHGVWATLLLPPSSRAPLCPVLRVPEAACLFLSSGMRVPFEAVSFSKASSERVKKRKVERPHDSDSVFLLFCHGLGVFKAPLHWLQAPAVALEKCEVILTPDPLCLF